MTLEETIATVVRAEIRAAFKEFQGGGLAAGDELLTYGQAAEIVGCSKTTIGAWVRAGRLPAAGQGKLRRVRRCDVLRAHEGEGSPQTSAQTAEQIADKILGRGNLRSVR